MDETSVRWREGIHWQRPREAAAHLPEIRWHTGTHNRCTGSAPAPETPGRWSQSDPHALFPRRRERNTSLWGCDFYTFRSPQISPSQQGHRRRSIIAGSQDTYPLVQQIKGDIHSDPMLSDEKKKCYCDPVLIMKTCCLPVVSFQYIVLEWQSMNDSP